MERDRYRLPLSAMLVAGRFDPDERTNIMGMRIATIAAAAALLAAAPAFAQMSSGDSMSSGSMKSGSMKMSAKDKKMMTKCQGMSNDMMMKNKSCMKMTKMHPGMMSNG